MPIVENKLSTLNDVKQIIDEAVGKNIYFRGESIKHEKPCMPSLGRNGKLETYIVNNELTVYKELQKLFIKKYKNERILTPISRMNEFGAGQWLSLYQHHGLPTRLLDWTKNINTALSFMINGWKLSKEEKIKSMRCDGYLYSLDVNKFKKYEKKIRNKILNGQNHNNELGFNFNYYKTFLDEENAINKEPIILTVDTFNASSDRQYSQQGVFTVSNRISGLLDILPKEIELNIYTVPSTLKHEIDKNQYELLGISPLFLTDPIEDIIENYLGE